MSKIKLNEKRFKEIVCESIKNVLNEGMIDKNTPVTLGELINAIGYTGNVNGLIRRAGANKATPDQWAASIEKQNVGRNQAMGTVYKQLANQIRQSVQDRGAVASGMEKSLNNGGQLTPVNPYSTGPGDQNVSPKGKMTYSQLTNAMANVGNKTMTFQMALNGSVGPWNGQNPQTVKNIIDSQIRTRKQTALQKFGQQNVTTAEAGLNNWLNGGNQSVTGKEVHSWMNVFDQPATSRNDVPIVQGFQKAANLFAGRQVLAVDGAVGKNTSAALKQAGFRDIFDFKNTVAGVQKALGLKPDGIVGKNTIAAFQQAGINSFDVLKNYTNALAKRANAPTAIVNPGQMNIPNQAVQSQAPAGQLAESRKIRITESELRSVIRESVESVLKDIKRK